MSAELKDGKYYDCWQSREDVVVDYGENTPTEQELVYAGYTYEGYSGSALIVFIRDGQWFENNDGHCSCNGLEDWNPESALPEAIEKYTGWPGLPEAVRVRS